MDQQEYRLAAIMYTDIAGFSRMMSQNETKALDALRRHNRVIDESAGAHGGRVIKTVGDAHLLEFSNTVNAIRSAVDIQRRTASLSNEEPGIEIQLRIGVHLGDIYFLEDDAIGEGINIASRLQAIAKPGRVCVSQDVYNLAASKVDEPIVKIGRVQLPNVDREIVAYEIAVGEDPVAVEREERRSSNFEDSSRSDAGSRESLDRAAGATQSGGTQDEAEAAGASKLKANLRSPEYADFNELKALVLAEIKKAGKRVSVDTLRERLPFKSTEVDRVLENLADKGYLTRVNETRGGTSYAAVRRPMVTPPDRRGDDQDNRREREIEARWEAALREASDDESSNTLIREYQEQTITAADKAKAGFRGHLGSFIGVNGFLFAIWLFTGAGFPWFLIPAMAWGIGLATHYSNTKDKQREAKDLQSFESLNREQLRIFRKLTRARSSFRSHLVSNIATSVFLLTLNMITSPAFPWSLFPIGGMAIGLFAHFPAFRAKERSLLRRLKEAGAQITGRGRRGLPVGSGASTGSGPAQEAQRIKDSILKQLSTFGKGSHPLGDDFESLLDNYVSQIRELSKKSADLEEILGSIPMGSLERDLHELERKRDQTSDTRVRAEYEKSIGQIRDQQESFLALKNDKEMLTLRVQSALNSLKQMQIDLARMKSFSPKEEEESLNTLRGKSQELSLYLEDLRKGYEELDR